MSRIQVTVNIDGQVVGDEVVVSDQTSCSCCCTSKPADEAVKQEACC